MKISITLLSVLLETNSYKQTLRHKLVTFHVVCQAGVCAGLHYMNLILWTVKKKTKVSEVTLVKNKFMAVRIKY